MKQKFSIKLKCCNSIWFQQLQPSWCLYFVIYTNSSSYMYRNAKKYNSNYKPYYEKLRTTTTAKISHISCLRLYYKHNLPKWFTSSQKTCTCTCTNLRKPRHTWVVFWELCYAVHEYYVQDQWWSPSYLHFAQHAHLSGNVTKSVKQLSHKPIC